MNDPNSHAPYAPSSSHRWINCTASFYKHTQDEISSIYAREGTVCHMIAARVLEEPSLGRNTLPYVGKTVNQITISEELALAMQEYVDEITSREAKLADPGPHKLQVEKTVEILDDAWGTLDAVVSNHNEIHVYDLKMGKGVVVDADHNEQLMMYALGILKTYDPFEAIPGHIYLHIVQPRSRDHETHKTFYTTPQELATFYTEQLLVAIDQIKYKSTTFNPGTKQCQWCNYKGKCRALKDYTMKEASIEFGKAIQETDLLDLNPFEIAQALKIMPMLDMWKAAILEEALASFKRGVAIPGFKVVESNKFRQYRDAAKAERYLVGHLGKKAYTRKILSPAQAEKLLKKDIELQSMIYKPPGDHVVAPASDKRSPVAATAEEEFKKIAVSNT